MPSVHNDPSSSDSDHLNEQTPKHQPIENERPDDHETSSMGSSDEDELPTPDNLSFEASSLAPWNTLSEDIHVTGTLVWYFSICQRQAWLMSRQIVPDEDDPNIEYGRFLHKQRYQRERKEYAILGGKIDLITMGKESLLITEVKKSSRYEEAATNQILFYLKKLKDQGIDAQGELRIPEEKKKIPVQLDEKSALHITKFQKRILDMLMEPEPPPINKTRWCKNCGYREFCWS